MLAGWAIGNFKSSADCFTGDETVSRPRPLGRSGCVTTSWIWNPVSTNLSSVGTANCGVPQKTRLRDENIEQFCDRVIERLQCAVVTAATITQSQILLPFSRFDQFADFALDQVALERADVTD